ncbi:MAG: deoxyribodipyrimidine photo-lyase [Metallosphaera sp.]
MICLFLFRRDLRLEDNTCLIKALRECDEVVPLFIIDPRQVEDNPYKSPFAIGFMIDSLLELDQDLKTVGSRLHLLKGFPEEIIPKINADAVYMNEDYTPFSRQRDERIKEKVKGKLVTCEDLLLTEKRLFLKEGKPYSVFTRFYVDVKDKPVRRPEVNNLKNYGEMKDITDVKLLENLHFQRSSFKGGRRAALDALNRAQTIDYSLRNFPGLPGTTRLSPYLKFGVLSPREVYYSVNEEIRRQLYWRDFFTLLAYYNPYVFGHAYKREYDCVPWVNDTNLFNAWTQGKTGYPIVDAGMRELNNTGFMHNRTRMITAFFLVKVLHVDWRWGEKYFATKLVDYDPSVNNGNWQWVASTGVDRMFRIFNPWLQQKKFDPEAVYIKEWVPELRDLSPADIHNVYALNVDGYPKPIVNYLEEVRKAREYYEKSRSTCN